MTNPDKTGTQENENLKIIFPFQLRFQATLTTPMYKLILNSRANKTLKRPWPL